eukprot:jgi/Mesvir1/18814/Mv04306-RA.1
MPYPGFRERLAPAARDDLSACLHVPRLGFHRDCRSFWSDSGVANDGPQTQDSGEEALGGARTDKVLLQIDDIRGSSSVGRNPLSQSSEQINEAKASIAHAPRPRDRTEMMSEASLNRAPGIDVPTGEPTSNPTTHAPGGDSPSTTSSSKQPTPESLTGPQSILDASRLQQLQHRLKSSLSQPQPQVEQQHRVALDVSSTLSPVLAFGLPKSNLYTYYNVPKRLPGIVPVVGERADLYTSVIPFQIISWNPRALYFPNFASFEICDAIVKAASEAMAPSTVAWRVGETPKPLQEYRTSMGTFLAARNEPTGALKWVEQQMARAMHIPRTHGEPFNVLRYENGQKYESHYDTFDPKEYGPQRSQRLASFLLYLSDVEEGGETVFPLADMTEEQINKTRIDYKACDKGVKVRPKKGDAMVFYSLTPHGEFEKTSLHGGCPVKKGTKWVAVKWIRDLSLGRSVDIDMD